MSILFSLIGIIFLSIFLLIRNVFIFVINALVIYATSQSISSNNIFIPRDKLIYNMLSIIFVASIVNIIVGNMFWTLLITHILFYILSLGFYYLHQFRGNNLSFADIFCIATAKEVAGGYKYDIKPQFLISLGVSIFSLFVFRHSIRIGNDFRLIFRIVFALALYILMRIICLQNKYNYSLNAGETEGYIYNFISSCPIFYIDFNNVVANQKNNVGSNQDNNVGANKDNNAGAVIDRPYNKANPDNNAGVNQEKNVYANQENNIETNQENNVGAKQCEPAPNIPHVICIMNESFSHINERIKTNIPVTPIYDGLKGVLKGNLLVNTFGGGTETTEFEFLTGMHIGSNPYPIYPYNHIKTEKYTLAKFFDDNNYRTMAMHPYTATNYHRNVIYKLFGFKEMYFYDEFKHKDTVRNYVSDDAMYDEVIDKYEETKKDNKKAFIFGITMQNHSGYDAFDGEEIEVTDYAEDKTSINSYLSLLHISDKSIKKLIDYFDKENERVLICFFGDHNASFNPHMNKRYYDISKSYEGKNVYETPFFIYDNKNKKDENIKQISTNFLSLELLKRTGLELSPYHQMLDEIYKRVYYMNFHKEKSREDNLLYYIDDIEKEYIELRNDYLR